MKNQIELVVGEEYLLFDLESEKHQNSFKGIYIGQNPVDKKNRLPFGIFRTNPRRPEGNTFVRFNTKREVEVYCDCSNERRVLLNWYSEGDDGPDWPAGFRVEKVASNCSSRNEIEYLAERIKRFEKQGRVA